MVAHPAKGLWMIAGAAKIVDGAEDLGKTAYYN
jgi:hypothetical protein